MKFGSLMFVMALATLLTAAKPAISVGFQQVSCPDPAGKPLAVAIWYPSDSPAVDSPLGMFVQSVATDAPVSGKQLPLVLISHGTSGSLASHYDTALALAKGGCVVAALTHTGDNTGDQSYTGNRIDLIDRPLQSHVVLDYLLDKLKNHSQIDPERIGMFGFSLGGFITLVEIGGTPDVARLALFLAGLAVERFQRWPP